MTDTLQRLWDEIPTGAAPVPTLMEAGARARRRRRSTVVGAAAAAVIAVLGVTSTLSQGDDDVSGEIASEPVPPEGTRYVGVGRVVVAVPADWLVGGGSDCLASELPDVGPAVPQLGPRAPGCSGIEQPWLRDLSAADIRLVELGLENRRSIDVGGLTGSSSDQRCPDNASCIADFTNTVLQIPSEGVVLQISGPPAVRDGVATSVSFLPEGWTTVPTVSSRLAAQTVDELERSGFAVVRERVFHDCPDNARCVAGASWMTVDPPAGTVVAEGSTITLTGHTLAD